MRRLLLVSAGTGPVEVRRFVALLAAWLAEACASRGLAVRSVTVSGEDEAPRSVTLEVSGGASLEGLLGTHALVARSATRGRRARKRWYAGVSAHDAPVGAAVEVDPSEVSFTACRAGGPGGQHVNTTASAVWATHGPTGLRVRVASERSQHANRRIALARLAEVLASRDAEKRAVGRDRRWRSHHRLERGRPVRTWGLDPGGAALVER
ncbi:MAG: peptide chain release factor-like protein [Alphaproteobacteria bacterium]|nr:peptide chain release factor-like protein [Alphaproteobacteria bacterium]